MTRRRALPVLLLVLLWRAAVVVAEPDASRYVDDEMSAGAGAAHGATSSRLSNRPGRFDADLRKRFLIAYRSSPDKRALFREYFPTLGADGILDAFEQADPLCHNQGHLLGTEIFAQLRDLAPAVAICGDRCTSGCMHGVVMEALGNEVSGPIPTEGLAARVTALCGERPMRETYPLGNCAHGVGHALLFRADYDLAKALEGCAAFVSPPIIYYCATGVFMEEDFKHGARDAKLHYPCDTYTRFPAACYKYKARYFLGRGEDEVPAAAAQCLPLAAPLRRGCFYGLGASQIARLAKDPNRLASVCSFGDVLDRTMCVNGGIERLGDYRPQAATTACATLDGELAVTCERAKRNGRYGLDKDFALYYGQ